MVWLGQVRPGCIRFHEVRSVRVGLGCVRLAEPGSSWVRLHPFHQPANFSVVMKQINVM